MKWSPCGPKNMNFFSQPEKLELKLSSLSAKFGKLEWLKKRSDKTFVKFYLKKNKNPET